MLNSPCDGNCKLDYKTKVCMGCYRTMDEILTWIGLTDEQKEVINQLADKRKKQYQETGKINDKIS